MKVKDKKVALFWIVMACMYIVSITLSYDRIYVRHEYPVFTDEEEIPDPLAPYLNFFNQSTV